MACDFEEWIIRSNEDFAMKRLNDATAKEWDNVALDTLPRDIQVGGDHYKQGSIQPMEYIMANDLGFAEGNVVKYITRHRLKNGIEDVKKARHYLDFILKEYLDYEASEKKYEDEQGIY